MVLDVGTQAPLIAGTDLVSGASWSLEAKAKKTVLVAFSGLTWCPPCKLEAPALESVWRLLKYDPKFTMAITSVGDGEPEPPEGLKAAIETFGITFPVVIAPNAVIDYEVAGVPQLYCLQWDEERRKHVVQGTHLGALFEKEEIESFLSGAGYSPPPWYRLAQNRGTKQIPPWFWDVFFDSGSTEGDAMLGLGIVHLAGKFQDAQLRSSIRNAGAAAAKAAVSRLEEISAGATGAQLINKRVLSSVSSSRRTRKAAGSARPRR